LNFSGSNLRIAVLNLFCTLKKRFQNLVVGNITRESVKRALANGITAEQVSGKHVEFQAKGLLVWLNIQSLFSADHRLLDSSRSSSDVEEREFQPTLITSLNHLPHFSYVASSNFHLLRISEPTASSHLHRSNPTLGERKESSSHWRWLTLYRLQLFSWFRNG